MPRSGLSVSASVVALLVALPGCDSSNQDQSVKYIIGDRIRLSAETWACDRKARDDLGKQHDREAFGRLLRRFQSTGKCRALQPGTTLDVVDVALIDGGSKVRIKGYPDEWWVTSRVIARTSEKIGRWR